MATRRNKRQAGIEDRAQLTQRNLHPGIRRPERRSHPEGWSNPMSTITPMMPAVAAADPQWVPSSLYRMTVEEYEAMVAAGTFRGAAPPSHQRLAGGEDDPQSPARDRVRALRGRAHRLVPPGWHVRPGPTRPSPRPGQRARARPLRRAGSGPGLPGRPSRAGRHRAGGRDRRFEPARRSEVRHRGLRARGDPVLLDRQLDRPPGRGLHRPGPAGYASRTVFMPGASSPSGSAASSSARSPSTTSCLDLCAAPPGPRERERGVQGD